MAAIIDFFKNRALAEKITQALASPAIEGFENNLPGLLAQVGDINASAFFDQNGRSLAYRLVAGGYTAHAIDLLARVKTQAKDALDILDLAIEKKSAATVDALLATGVGEKVIVKNVREGCLGKALRPRNYDKDVLTALLKDRHITHGAYLDRTEIYRLTIDTKNLEAAKILAGSDVPVNSEVLWSAVVAEEESFVKFLAYCYDNNPDAQDGHPENRTALMQAVADENDEIVHNLLMARTNVDLQDSGGDTAMHLAVRTRNPKLVALIQKFNPDITIKNKEGQTAADLAIDMAKSTPNYASDCGGVIAEYGSVNLGSREIFDLLIKPVHTLLEKDVVLQEATNYEGEKLRTVFHLALGVGRPVSVVPANDDKVALEKQQLIEEFDPKLVAAAKLASQKLALG